MRLVLPKARHSRACPVCAAHLAVFDRTSLYSLQGRPWLGRHADLSDVALSPDGMAVGRVRLAIGDCAHCGHAYYATEVLICEEGSLPIDRWLAGDVAAAGSRNALIVPDAPAPDWLYSSHSLVCGARIHQHVLGPFEVDVVTIMPEPLLPGGGQDALAAVSSHVAMLAQKFWEPMRQAARLAPIVLGVR